jgi:hypothetical protein
LDLQSIDFRLPVTGLVHVFKWAKQRIGQLSGTSYLRIGKQTSRYSERQDIAQRATDWKKPRRLQSFLGEKLGSAYVRPNKVIVAAGRLA